MDKNQRKNFFYDENNLAYKMTGVHTDIDEFIKLQEDNAKKRDSVISTK